MGGYLIPKGYHLLLHMPFARLESESFPSRSPTAFEPERWLDEQQQLIKEPRFFIPFGEGPRHCVGWRLAMEESKVCLALGSEINHGAQLGTSKCSPLGVICQVNAIPDPRGGLHACCCRCCRGCCVHEWGCCRASMEESKVCLLYRNTEAQVMGHSHAHPNFTSWGGSVSATLI